MKLSESWLREWVNPPVDARALAARLTMAGIEAEGEPLTSDPPRGVVVAKILACAPHPQADRLRVCEIDAGGSAPLTIVCGAANARPGILVPAALPGAVLPGGKAIGQASLRGVDSAGMLCSAAELGLAEKSEGLLELDPGAAPGTPIEKHLGLDDRLLNLELTPNRGDCLSIAGVAREVGALYALDVLGPNLRPAVVVGHEQQVVVVEDSGGCPHYLGRVIAKLKPDVRTPDWMRERLRRSGIRTIHPLVDITNYVMIELGQPLHAFDRARLSGPVRIRRARTGERLSLLDGQSVELAPQDLLIADDSGPLVLAGVMGGVASGVSAQTSSVFVESACFDPVTIAGAGRRHKILSDSRYRNERGVDPALQRKALDRATQLITQICGGEPGPITEVGRAPAQAATINLRHSQVTRLLGCDIAAHEVPELLMRLGIEMQNESAGAWRARIPTHRYDLRLEADLVEEVGRLYGYERIPARAYAAQLTPSAPSEAVRSADAVKDCLIARGYQEVLTYSFVDPRLQAQLDPGAQAVMLDNPIAETLSAMRTNLWSGLVTTWQHNRQRQQRRARLFELGSCYALDGSANREATRLGGLVAGTAQPEQWGTAERAADFYDVKADLEALLGASLAECRFETAGHPALHPGRSARVRRGERELGWIGALHPRLAQSLDLGEPPVLFELDWALLRETAVPRAQPLSEFPSSRRDLSVVLAESVTAEQLLECARTAGGGLLKSAFLFDIYRGPGLREGCRSISLGLIFQEYSRTLNDDEVDAAVAAITARVAAELGGSIRSN
jgi:phenylalanyl-tRNA synthetase beta chain